MNETQNGTPTETTLEILPVAFELAETHSQIRRLIGAAWLDFTLPGTLRIYRHLLDCQTYLRAELRRRLAPLQGDSLSLARQSVAQTIRMARAIRSN
jgi:hypothetical protein